MKKKQLKLVSSLLAVIVPMVLAYFGLATEENVLGELARLETEPQKIATASGNLEWEVVTVAEVTDGDTIKLSDGRKVRYIGIDTPETVDPRRAVGCFGKEASAKNQELVAGKVVQLEKDVSETDRYGRLLRYVYVEGVMINELLVREGYAKASSYPPDVKYQELFKEAETSAREHNLGMWSEACAE